MDGSRNKFFQVLVRLRLDSNPFPSSISPVSIPFSVRLFLKASRSSVPRTIPNKPSPLFSRFVFTISAYRPSPLAAINSR